MPPFSRVEDSVWFSINVDVCAAFPSRRASRSSSKGLEEMILDRVVYVSAIASSFLHNHLTGAGSKKYIYILLFLNDRAISPGHVQVLKIIIIKRSLEYMCFIS